MTAKTAMTAQPRIDAGHCRRLLRERLLQTIPEEGTSATGIAGLNMHRFHSDSTPRPMMYQPVLIVVVQGSKWAKIGEAAYTYSENTCFVAGVDMPVTSGVRDASPERPYLSLSLDLDKALIASLAAEMGADMPPHRQPAEASCGAVVQDVDAALLDALLRLLELAEDSARRSVMEPLIKKEIHFLLLRGALGGLLRDIHTNGTHGHQITEAIAWLQQNFTQPLRIETLARHLHMAPSTLHKHFKSITTVSPLQYQKRLRLLEARRLMLGHSHDTGQASVAVGYDSLTQFNREYKRLFGEPPRRDVQRLSATVQRTA